MQYESGYKYPRGRICTFFTIGMILIVVALFLCACQCPLKSYETARELDFEKEPYQQGIHKACLWLDKNPVNTEVEEPLAILEEVIAFYMLWKNTKDSSKKTKYIEKIQKRIDYFASKEDIKVQPKEYTLIFPITMIVEKLHIKSVDFRKIIEEQMMSSPALFSQNITNTIWITAYLERLGYEPPLDLKLLMDQSNIQQELNQKLLYHSFGSSMDQRYINNMVVTSYHITHEILSLTNWGELPPPPIIGDNKVFFSDFFNKGIQWAISINHIDLLGEFIMCVKMLDLKDVSFVQTGIEHILSNQEENGTFGITNPSLPNIYRHGILVSMMVLSMAR